MLEILDRGALAHPPPPPACGRSSRIMRSTSSPVPTGTVDLVTTTVKPVSAAAISRAGGGNIAEIGVAVATPGRRADRDKDGIGLCNRFFKVCGEIEAARPHVGFDKPVKAGLVDLEFDFPGAPRSSQHPCRRTLRGGQNPQNKKEHPESQPDISRSDHSNAHKHPSTVYTFPPTPNSPSTIRRD